MAKKRKHQASANRPEPLDKPDWAADLFLEEKRKKPNPASQPEKDNQKDATLEERLNRDVVNQLAALKARMKEVAPKPTPPTAKTKPVVQRDVRTDDDGEVSFAELFDPVEPDEDSFDDMLKSSKLDWRSFTE